MRVFRGVVAQHVEQRVGHVGLEAERLGPIDHFQQLHHPLPTVHAAPADFAFGGQPLAEILGDVAGLAERVGDALLIGLRVPSTTVGGADGRVDPHDAVRAECPARAAAWRCGSPCEPASRNCLRSSSLAHRRAAARRRPDRRDDRADHQLARADLVGQLLRVRRRDESMLTCGANRNRSTPSNFTPSTSAAAVRSSIVSRSIGGSTPALCRQRPARRRCEVWGRLLDMRVLMCTCR